MNNDYSLVKSLVLRFVRGFGAAFVGATSTLVLTTSTTWQSLFTNLNTLGVLGVAAGITGGLLALDKYFRAE